jgi:hypothetical protein
VKAPSAAAGAQTNTTPATAQTGQSVVMAYVPKTTAARPTATAAYAPGELAYGSRARWFM